MNAYKNNLTLPDLNSNLHHAYLASAAPQYHLPTLSALSDVNFIVDQFRNYNLGERYESLAQKTQAVFTETKFKQIGEGITMEEPDDLRSYFEENMNVFEQIESMKQIIKEVVNPKEIIMNYYFDVEDEWDTLLIKAFVYYASFEEFEEIQNNLYAVVESRIPKYVSEKVTPSVYYCYK